MSAPTDHARRIRDAVNARDGNSALTTSWRRSLLLHRLDPDDGTQPNRLNPAGTTAALVAAASLIEAATRHLDQLFALIDCPDYCVLLSDADGIVVDVRTSAKVDFWDRPSNQWAGTDLSERSEGTNATGTALIEQRPTTIDEDDHFHTRNQHILCDGAPIYGTDDRTIGTIDVARSASEEPALLGSLIMFAVIETARRIELARFRRAFPKARLTLPPVRAGCVISAVVAVGDDDLVVGATHAARQALDLSDERMATPFPADYIWPVPDVAGEGALAAAERRVILRALAHHGDNISAAAKALGISRGTLHRKRAQWPSSQPTRVGLKRP